MSARENLSSEQFRLLAEAAIRDTVQTHGSNVASRRNMSKSMGTERGTEPVITRFLAVTPAEQAWYDMIEPHQRPLSEPGEVHPAVTKLAREFKQRAR